MNAWHNKQGSLEQQLNHTLNALHNWGRKTFGIIPRRVKEAQQDLLNLQQNQTTPNITNDHQINQKEKELDDLLEKEEMWWSQRSRALWVTHGDKNTKYFHQKASYRRKKNKIDSIKDTMDQTHNDQEDIENIFINHLQLLFTSQPTSNIDTTVQVVKNRLGQEMYDYLNMDFTKDEVVIAIKDMKSLAAPGPDGLPDLFYHTYCDIVGEDITEKPSGSLTMVVIPSPIIIPIFALYPKQITLPTQVSTDPSPFVMSP
jgi:hypothetical protein